jgi:hypothetical protein
MTAAATGRTAPDVLSRRLLCKLELVAHPMILGYWVKRGRVPPGPYRPLRCH